MRPGRYATLDDGGPERSLRASLSPLNQLSSLERPRPLRSRDWGCSNPPESRNLIEEKDNASRPNLPVVKRHNFSRRLMVLRLLPGKLPRPILARESLTEIWRDF